MADFGFPILVLWEIILTAFTALILFQGYKGMVLSCALLFVGNLLTMGETGVDWGMVSLTLAALALGLGIEIWVKQKSNIQGFLSMETGVLGMIFLLAFGMAMVPVALVAGALCGGLILRRFIFVPGFSRWILFLYVERIFFSLVWLVLGNLI
jgi:hypothetical protein